MVEDQAVTWGKRDEMKEQKWRGLLEEHRRGKQSVRAFCRERGLKEASLYRWRQVIGQRDLDADATGAEALPSRMPTLAPVVVIDGPSGDTKSSAAAVIEIVLGGGAMVRVPCGSTSEQLGMVLDVLGRSRC